MVICYIILHYNDIETTKEAVSKLQNISHNNYHIIIVDNFSPNKSGHELLEFYKNVSNIDVIITEKNLGFAKGNNVGYNFALDKYRPNLMIIMNNDIFIKQINFEDEIIQYMSQNKIDIAGPNIINLKGINQNPLQNSPIKTFTALMTILGNFIKTIVLIPDFAYKLYLDFKTYKLQNKKINFPQNDNQIIKQPILHGSCIIFGQKYLNNEKFAFVPCTFMYAEEHILYDYAKYKGYSTGIATKVSVKHLEDKSTNASFTSDKSKLFFIYKNQTNSLIQLLRLRIKYCLQYVYKKKF